MGKSVLVAEMKLKKTVLVGAILLVNIVEENMRSRNPLAVP
jgi:hypothetical protein